LETGPWDVPATRSFTSDRYEVRPAPHHVMQEFYEDRQASVPEKAFTAFLEDNGEAIDWWYKNGDSGKEHFSVATSRPPWRCSAATSTHTSSTRQSKTR
jgi:type III restriction enzyme